MNAPSLRVLVVELHQLLAESLAEGLRAHAIDDVDVRSGGSTIEQLVDGLAPARHEVVVLGLRSSDAPADLLPMLLRHGARVLVLTSGDDPALLAASLEAGATGVFTTRQPLVELSRYIVDAARGATLLSPVARTELVSLVRDRRHDRARALALFDSLTSSEEAVLEDLARGRNPEEIARERYVAVSTVRSQIRSILLKLGVNSQLAAVTLAFRSGWPRLRELA
jgi:two-component system, NarL family, nitrate/nitrite response regulator NarL